MAVITQLNQDPNQQQQQNGTNPATVPVVGGRQSASIPSTGQTGVGTGSAIVNNNTPATSGNFTNLQNYLNANKGAGSNIANKLGQNVQQSADQTNKDVAATGTIQSQLDAEKNRLAQASGFANQIQNGDPTQIANNSDTLNAVTQLRQGTNNADTINALAQQKLNTAQNDLQTLQQNAANTATENGRFQLLQQTLGRPTYNQGQQSLDNLLVQNGGQGVLDNLQKSAQQTVSNATNSLGQTSAQLSSGIGDVKSQAAADATAIQNAIGKLDDPNTTNGNGALGNLQQSLQQRQQDFIKQNQSLYDRIQSEKTGTTYDSDIASLLKLKDGQDMFNVNAGELVNPNWAPDTVTEQSVADSNDLSKYQALAKIAGVDANYLNPNAIGKAQGVSVDPTALQGAIGQRQAQLDQLMGTDYAKNLSENMNDYINSNPGWGTYNGGLADVIRQNGATPETATKFMQYLQKTDSPQQLAAIQQRAQTGQGSDDDYYKQMWGQGNLDNLNRIAQIYKFASQYAPIGVGNLASVKAPDEGDPATDNTFRVVQR